MNEPNREDSVTLEILQAIDETNNVTQRHLSERLGVALGLTNSYLKRCAKKGFIKVQQAPANRYFYYLTPKGFTEKSRLTAEYLTSSFGFYRKASQSIHDVLSQCQKNQQHNILLYGISELAEIALLKAMEFNIDVIGTVDPYTEKKEFLHLPVWNKLEQADDFDVCILTALKNSEQIYSLIMRDLPTDKLLVPSLLGLNRSTTKTN